MLDPKLIPLAALDLSNQFIPSFKEALFSIHPRYSFEERSNLFPAFKSDLRLVVQLSIRNEATEFNVLSTDEESENQICATF